MKKLVFITSLLLFFSFTQNESSAKTINKTKAVKTVKEKDYSNLFKDIEKKYKIKVFYKNSEDYFPEAWITEEINPKLFLISEKELKRFPKLIDKELAKYSPSVLNKNLKGIYLSKAIEFYNVGFGATNSDNGIYISSDGIENNYTDHYLIGMIHHEFSSILMRNYEFKEDEWISWNPREFSYKSGGVQALKDHEDSLDGNEELYKQGILSQYSLASFEEDFNVYTSMIFSEPKKFYQLMQKYPLIKEKFNIWLKFYNSFDKKITEDYLFNKTKI